MKKYLFFQFLLVVMALLVLSACSPTKYELIEKTEYVYIGIGDTLTEHIVPPAPPRQNYVEAQGATAIDRAEQRLQIVTDYTGVLIGTTIKQNQRLDSIKQQDEKNKNMVLEMNNKEQERVKSIIEGRTKELKSEN